MCMPAFLSSPPQHWTPPPQHIFPEISFFHFAIWKFCSRVHYLRCCHTFLIKLCYQSEQEMWLTSYSVQPEDWSINNIDPSKGLWHVQSFYKEKSWKKKLNKSNVYPLSLLTQGLCLSVRVCASASGKPQNYSLLFWCSTDTVWITPSISIVCWYLPWMLALKKNQQTCLEGTDQMP